jgi:nicotinamide mononucleotide adenylyltransferase
MHSESTTDLSKIRSNINLIKSDGENVVLISTGSMNPIHRSHISNMIKTKNYLENVYHLNVLGGFISPTHDQYVEGKLGNELIFGIHRIEMCQKAIEEENQQNWLAVDKAECMGM